MKTFLSISLVFGLAACGGSSGSRNNDTVDLSGPHTVVSGDMAMTVTGSTDMAMASGMVGCKATIECEDNCVMAGGSQQTEQACTAACDANETPNGKQLEGTLATCVETACPQQADMGAEAQCQMTVQSSGGSCYSANMACNADM